MIAAVSVASHARLYGWVWRTARLIFALALGFFVTIYFLSVVPSDYGVTTLGLAVQPIAFAALVLSSLLVGHLTRSISLGAMAIYVIFALSMASMLINLLSNPQIIINWSEQFPDPRPHQLLSRLGPNGPVIFFLGWIAPVALVVMGGSVAAVALRWLRVQGVGRTVRQIDLETRRVIAERGDAPRLWRRLSWSRWRGWAYGIAAALVLLAPTLLSGREFAIPATGDWHLLLPEFLSRILVAVTDRWLAVMVAVLVSAVLWRRALSHWAPTARLVLGADDRPPILLLRSFKDDRAAVPVNELWRRLLVVPWLSKRRLEEVAARSLARVLLCSSGLMVYWRARNRLDTESVSPVGPVLE